MVLCNMNQTVITASSDRTIRAWSPHADGDLAVPALIGHHTDYVRSLAFAKYPKALFSGALDRDITVWDIQSPRPNEPVLKVRLSEMDDQDCVGLEGEWGSIYALAVGESSEAHATEVVVPALPHQRQMLTYARPCRPDTRSRHTRTCRASLGPTRR